MRKVCVVTGSRAEYGLLKGLMRLIDQDPDLQLQVIATNMHLSPEFGLTYREIEKDGFVIDKKVQMLLSSDTANATAKSVGLGTIGFADAYEDLKPDLIVVLGDRYEILSAVSTALFYKIPVAHLHGGEISEGAYDDCIRHAITKMSHLHFTSTEEYRKRVIQLGESPERVFNVGAPGVENIKKIPLMSREELQESMDGFDLGNKSLLVTYHPVTLENATAAAQCEALLECLDKIPDYKVVFTLPNSDTDGRVIIQMINEYIAKNSDRCIAYPSLGLTRYLSALKYVTAVVGNSSSGIIEVPSFGKPTLDIGDRQKGRIAATSVCHCSATKDRIMDGLNKILSKEFIQAAESVVNPYDGGDSSVKIYKVLKLVSLENIEQKHFYDIR